MAAATFLHADESKWHTSGFLNQALISSSDNNFFGKSDDGISHDYWEAGYLISGTILPKLELSSQLLARKAGLLDNGHPRIDQLLLTYRFQDDFDSTQGVRVGRSKQYFGLYNATRDVPFTRPGILLPQSTYFDRARNSLLIVDELAYFYEIRKESGTWHLDAGEFRSLPNNKEISDCFNVDVSVKASGDYGNGLQITWRSPEEQFFTGLTVGHTKSDFDARNTSLFNPDGSFNLINADGHSRTSAINVFVQYSFSAWLVSIERTQVHSTFINMNQLAPLIEANGFGYYGQVEYHLNQKSDLFFRYDVDRADKNDLHGNDFARSPFAIAAHLPGFVQYTNDASIGYSLRPNSDWMIRLEFHNIEGVSWVSHIENNDPRGLTKYWNLALAQVSYRF